MPFLFYFSNEPGGIFFLCGQTPFVSYCYVFCVIVKVFGLINQLSGQTVLQNDGADVRQSVGFDSHQQGNPSSELWASDCG